LRSGRVRNNNLNVYAAQKLDKFVESNSGTEQDPHKRL
jgi:hypothetical protein